MGWDPERFISPGKTAGKEALTTDVRDMRSIQIGLKGHAVAEESYLNPEFVLQITDVTSAFRQAHQALTSSPPDVQAATALLWPGRREEPMFVPYRLRDVLSMRAKHEW